MEHTQKVLIVGGVAGGASAAARLRRLDEKAEIVLFEKGEYISFANCGLPYYIGGEITQKSALTLQTPQSFYARFAVDVRTRQEVTAIDRNKKEVKVKNYATGEIYTESYDKLILSPGAEPVRPNLPGLTGDRVFTLRSIPDTYRIREFIDTHHPKRAVVVGGGFIGVEMAENLTAAGVAVTLVEMSDQVIAPLDPEMAREVEAHMTAKGVTLRLGASLEGVRETENNLAVKVSGTEMTADFVVLAIGVRPESALARDAGLSVNERGAIIVDDGMHTSDPDIFAVGDAIAIKDFVTGQPGYVPLAGPANKQGRIAADNICGLHKSYHGTQGSSVLKVFDLTVAATGLNEKAAKRAGVAYDKMYTYSANHAGYYPGAVNMSIKTLFEKETGKILGAQVVGYDGVDKRCDVFATAIRAGMTAYDLTELELCYAPPYGSAKDPVNMAGFAIENVLTGKVKQFHWHDVAALPQDGSVTLLDTRTPLEYANGSLPGFINIPLDELRDRLQELDATKPVYLTCQIGLRGYIGSRILSQNGFDVYNLSGGYRLYHSIFGKAPTSAPKAPTPKIEHIGATAEVKKLDACGLQCPGPIVRLSGALEEAAPGQMIEISTTDPAFASDLEGFCRRTGNEFCGMQSEKGVCVARVRKAAACPVKPAGETEKDKKNIIVFSGDLDKAIASFIIANAAAAMGRKVSMFFTFWGLNVLRKPEKVHVKKDFMSTMFGKMMPRGSKKLGLSKMNMGGMGAKMIRGVMQNKNISSLEDLIHLAQQNGVELVACSMSMDVMGITPAELIDGVKLGGAAAMIANAEESDMSLFI
ncbi:DsrE/DsrF/DrsH-like family protein [Pygmaiobacter massiliensis]|uniref:DsrE/DsrF/DrsH-like family protein n=1 Tax=Pygmaiobacter massiliensis TaxID=1917873 RepID=UPI002A829514|nr:DsrE/DsrF/DrsH-like family protein [Pygmaiobacter massiliensis]MDY4784169.1 FAD-dependent oxidoreductase [Pygmaiobacter massiliensis]